MHPPQKQKLENGILQDQKVMVRDIYGTISSKMDQVSLTKTNFFSKKASKSVSSNNRNSFKKSDLCQHHKCENSKCQTKFLIRQKFMSDSIQISLKDKVTQLNHKRSQTFQSYIIMTSIQCLLGTHPQLWNHYEQCDSPNTHQQPLHQVFHLHLLILCKACV